MRSSLRSCPWLLLALGAAACEPGAGTVDPSAWPPFTVRGAWEDASSLRYRVESSGGPVDDTEFRRLVRRATEVWSASGRVGFVLATDGAACDVRIGWGKAASDEDPDAPFGRDSSVARTGPVGPGCFVEFDASREWLEVHGRGASLFQAAVHELGHVIGLGHVERLDSVMHSQWDVGVSDLSVGDLAGVHSLYGGGPSSRGDLSIESGKVSSVLRRVAPPDLTQWATFDVDGDGDHELLVWGTGAVGHGALMIYHFSKGLRLARTDGPILGVVGPTREATPGVDAEGRFLAVRDGSGRCVRRPFDDRGWLLPAVGDVAWPTSEQPMSTDLDGDGAPDRVGHP